MYNSSSVYLLTDIDDHACAHMPAPKSPSPRSAGHKARAPTAALGHADVNCKAAKPCGSAAQAPPLKKNLEPPSSKALDLEGPAPATKEELEALLDEFWAAIVGGTVDSAACVPSVDFRRYSAFHLDSFIRIKFEPLRASISHGAGAGTQSLFRALRSKWTRAEAVSLAQADWLSDSVRLASGQSVVTRRHVFTSLVSLALWWGSPEFESGNAGGGGAAAALVPAAGGAAAGVCGWCRVFLSILLQCIARHEAAAGGFESAFALAPLEDVPTGCCVRAFLKARSCSRKGGNAGSPAAAPGPNSPQAGGGCDCARPASTAAANYNNGSDSDSNSSSDGDGTPLPRSPSSSSSGSNSSSGPCDPCDPAGAWSAALAGALLRSLERSDVKVGHDQRRLWDRTHLRRHALANRLRARLEAGDSHILEL
eukprot:tig00000189_g14342.t1